MLVFQGAVDFRKAHDGLCAIIREHFTEDPFGQNLFVFFNRSRNRIKILMWDRNGYWLLYKRLEAGTFPAALSGRTERVEISRAQLTMLLDGLEWKSAKPSQRYRCSVRIRGKGEGNADQSARSSRP